MSERVSDIGRLHLLGRHVARAARNAFDARHVRILDQRDAEIDDAHVVVEREHDVARLDVAMNDAAAMRVVQALRALEQDLDDVVDAQQVVGAAIRVERARAVHVLRDDVVAAVFLARVVDRQDVGVLEAPHHLRFVEEHLASDARLLLVFLALDVVELDRDVAAVIRIVRQEYSARAALPDLVDDDVLADSFRHVARAALLGGGWSFCLGHSSLDCWQQYSDRCDAHRRVDGSDQVVKHNSEAAL